jgi:MOSC domain-containing protein YiiM
MARIIAVCTSESKGTPEKATTEGIFARVIRGGTVMKGDMISEG